MENINTSFPNDGLGDKVRNAFIKVNNNFTELDTNKVNKVLGKGLSTEDYTTSDKALVSTALQADALNYLGANKENVVNKQNSLAVDGTGIKFPTVDAVNSGFVNVLTPQNVAGQKTFTNGISAQNVNYLDFINIDWAGLGDSTTFGVGSTTGTTSYFDIVSARIDFKSTTKLGASGATVMPTGGRTKLSDIIPTIPAGTDLITLMIGINDRNLSNPIGDVYATLKKSFVSLDETVSFAEAFRYNLETIKNNFPNAKIIVITPTKVDNTIVGDFDTKFYVDAEIAIANWLSIPVINAHENSGINSNTPIFLSDGLHPNDAGYQLIANKVQAGLITNPENISSNTFNDAVIADNVTVGGTSTTGTDGKILFKGFRGVTQGRIEMYPFGGLGVPSTVIFSSGTGIGSGFSYFNAESGRYGFGTTTDNGVDKLQVNGSVLVKKFTVDDSINGILRTILSNSSTGTDNMNSLTFRNDLGQISDITLFGSNWIPSGLGDDVANGVRLFSSGIGGISLRNTGVSASTRFYTGSSEVMRIGSNVLISTTTDNGVDKLQVNGSVLATSFNGSATLTGTPTAPTATAGTNTTQIATTAFVTSQTNSKLNIASPIFTGDIFGQGNYISEGELLLGSTNKGISRYGSSNISFREISNVWTSSAPVSATYFKPTVYTVSSLPSPPITGTGTYATVSDALSPTYMATVVGGGAIVTPVFFDGVSWRSH